MTTAFKTRFALTVAALTLGAMTAFPAHAVSVDSTNALEDGAMAAVNLHSPVGTGLVTAAVAATAARYIKTAAKRTKKKRVRAGRKRKHQARKSIATGTGTTHAPLDCSIESHPDCPRPTDCTNQSHPDCQPKIKPKFLNGHWGSNHGHN